MTGASHTNLVALFDGFLVHLRQQGFTIGVDHYLRLQELLNRMGGQCDPAELKTLLCPLFATHRNQQEKFYQAFDTHFALLQIAPEAQALEGDAQQPETNPAAPHTETEGLFRSKKGILFFTAAILAASILALIFLKLPSPPDNANQNGNQNSARQGDNNSADNPTNRNASTPTSNRNSSPPPPELTQNQPTFGPGPNQSQPPPPLAFIDREVIRWSIIATPLVFFLIFEWLNYRRRKLVLQKQRGEKPPFVYTLRLEGPDAKLFNSELLYTAVRRMRRRQLDKVYSLDIAATVAATSRTLGYPTFKYKSGSKIPEYLVLIDRASFRDHQAQLFESLMQALRKEGLYIVSYYYNGDPRICCDQHDNCAHIVQLQNKYPDHHLLIFGDGDSLVDPLTGELEPWSAYFLHWQSCALLTPEAPARWGLREEVLARHFFVTTADLKGLLELVDSLEQLGATGPRPLRRSGGGELVPQEHDQADLIQSLRQYLGEAVFQWLCACAVYPELHWGLSLFLGSLPCMEGNLIKEENLLRLAKLPWFRKGAIPDDIRLLLIGYLDKAKEKAIRAAIIELLEQSPRAELLQQDAGNFSANTYALNLAVERWLYHRDTEHRFRLRKVIIKLPKEQVYRDYTLIRFLESPLTSRLALLLPKTLRAIFYPNAISKLNPRISLRFILTIGLTLLAWAGLNWTMPPLSKARILDFSASQISVEAGGTANLFFQVSGAAGLRIDPDIGDLQPTEQGAELVTLEQTTTYKLTARDSAGRSISRELTIEVTGKDHARIVSFYANPPTVVAGVGTQLCYELRNVDRYKISSDTYGLHVEMTDSFLPSECKPFLPIKTTTYTLEATGKDGYPVSQSVTVEVVATDAVRIDSFKADAAIVGPNKSTRLCFQVSNAIKTEIVANSGETVNITGNCATVKPAATTVYTLIATGQNGDQQRQSLTVSVINNTQPFIKEFSANPAIINPGDSVQICSQVLNAWDIWMTNNVDNGIIDFLVAGITNFDGRESLDARRCKTITLTQTTTFRLLAKSRSGISTANNLSVEVRPGGIRITGITTNPNPVIAGQEAVMCIKTDDSQNLDSVTLTPPLGRQSVRGFDPCFKLNIQEATTYNVTVRSRNGGVASQQFTIQVQPAPKAPVITSLTANPSAIAQGEKVDVCYRVENADGVTYSEKALGARLPGRLDAFRGYAIIPVMARQSTSGFAIRGSVVFPDPGASTGAQYLPVEGAQVIAQLKGINVKYTALTDSGGGFRLSGLPVGDYLVFVIKPGYEDSVTDNVMVGLTIEDLKLSRIILRRKGDPRAAPTSPDTSQSGAGPQLPMFVKGNQNCLSFRPTRTTTYTVTATTSAGTDTKSVTVGVK